MYSYDFGRKAVSLLVGLTVVFVVGCAPPPASLSESDLSTIRAAGDAFAAAGSASDWAAVAALYTEDAILMPPNAPAVSGTASIQATFEAFPPVTAMELDIKEIQGAGDFAYVRGSYRLAMDFAGQSIEDRGKYLEIRRKQADGSWPIVLDTWNSDMPLPTPEEDM